MYGIVNNVGKVTDSERRIENTSLEGSLPLLSKRLTH